MAEQSGRVVVVSQDDADTITDCLDRVADQCPKRVEIVVVDQDSADDTADVAIRHPAVDRVVPVPRGDLQSVADAGSREAQRALFLRADTAPGPQWVASALAALDAVPVAFGPDRQIGNLAVDLTRLRRVRLLAGAPDLDEVLRRAHLAGACSALVDDMVVSPAAAVRPRTERLPVTTRSGTHRPRYRGTISIVLCTKDRPAHLARCLDSLGRLGDDDHDVIVVDNHAVPTVDPEALPPRVRVVHEPRPGLDSARNRGLHESDGGVIAYIDDDCEADVNWVDALRVAFADPHVGFVTGRVRPASLALPTQRYFEAQFSFDRGPLRQRFTPWDDRRWYPLWTGPLGTGCNMAFRRHELLAVGGFDELLDVGSTIGGGGDLDVFARLLDRKVIAEYAPNALVWHHHRDTPAGLRRQFRGYGEAGGAYLMKAVLERPGMRLAAIRFFGDRLAARVRTARRIRRGSHLLPARLLVVTVLGQLTGPARYVRARWAPLRR